MGIYTPKISPSKLLWGKNDVRTATEQFYIPPPKKKTYPPKKKQISGYAPGWKVVAYNAYSKLADILIVKRKLFHANISFIRATTGRTLYQIKFL